MAIGQIRGLSFSEPTRSNRMTGGAGAGASASTGANKAALNRPNWGGLAVDFIEAESIKRRAIMQGNAAAREKVINAIGITTAEEIKADGYKEAQEKKSSGNILGGIIQTGATLIGSALISDERTKNNIENIEDALATLRELRPVTFYYNEEYSSTPERQHHGFIAQEYIKHMPDATYYDESIDRMCIDTIELIALLVRSVQQLETKVTRMEAQHALVGV